MEYKPRFAQPFTLTEAIQFDVSLITEEIARLQNSLQLLRQTQELLREHAATEPEVDVEISKAIEENEVVIGSQEERIGILKMALSEKGIIAGSHYDLAAISDGAQSTGQVRTATTHAPTNGSESVDVDADGEDGIHL